MASTTNDGLPPQPSVPLVTATSSQAAQLGWTSRRRLAVATTAALIWGFTRAGVDNQILNVGGWSSFSRFWRALVNPELAGDFLRLTWDATVTTLSFAVLGSVLSLLLGAIGAVGLSELFAGRGMLWRSVRALLVIPRAIHEILWALLLVQVLGFDPLVAVLAIAIPFGAVTAKVFAETFDEADRAPFLALRASGANRVQAFAYGVLPSVRGDLVSYAFYRFECAIRSAAVLGVIGVGGLGFQLDLSFETLRYGEIWTLIAALMLLSGGAEAMSTRVRSSRSRLATKATIGLLLVLIPLSVNWSGIDPRSLWSARTVSLARSFGNRIFPPRLGPDGWGELVSASIDTIAMSVLATALAATMGLALALLSRGSGSSLRSFLIRLCLLLTRAVPAPIWAFLFVLILFPGIWPGVVGLAVYNIGVLGRLFAETIDEADDRPTAALAAIGATPTQRFFYGLLPTTAPRLLALALYRWEVIVRETVVVGVVGAGGLGQLINEHLAARDFAAVLGALGAMVVIALCLDALSATARTALR